VVNSKAAFFGKIYIYLLNKKLIIMHSLHFLHFLRNRELDEIYASVAIRSFALSMISIFIPIYFLSLNYSLKEVFLFYAVIYGVHTLVTLPAGFLVSKFGFKHCILFSLPFLIAFYALLYTLGSFGWSILLLAFLFGINSALFWVGFHTDFARFSDKKYRGEELGLVNIFSSLAGVAGPLIGGLIIAFIGFHLLFALVLVLIFFSAIPLFFSKDIHEPFNFSLRQIFTDHRIEDCLAFFGHGVEIDAYAVLWPTFIFLFILNDFPLLGFVAALSLFFSLLSTFVIARLSDIKRKAMLRIGALFNALIWGLRTAISTSLQVFIIDSFYGISKIMKQVSFNALSYDKATRENILEFILFRELIIPLGRASLFISMIFLSDFKIGFIFASAASLLYLLF